MHGFLVDMLEQNEVKLSIKNGKSMFLIDSNKTVQLDENVEIPPSWKYLCVLLLEVNHALPGGVSGFVHATDNVLNGAGLLAIKMLASVNNCHVTQKFANMSDQSINLKKHMTTDRFHALNDTGILLTFDDTSHSDNHIQSVHIKIPQSQLDFTQTAVNQHELSESSNTPKLAQCTNQPSGNCLAQESHNSKRSLSSSNK